MAPIEADGDSRDSGDEDPSCIADVFQEMLNINEDMITTIAQYQDENDFDSALSYQRILHRNLMEMANFVDSMFGVYSNEEVPLNAESSKDALNEQDSDSSVLLATLEAKEKLRSKRRTHKRWLNTQQQVKEEEKKSAVALQINSLITKSSENHVNQEIYPDAADTGTVDIPLQDKTNSGVEKPVTLRPRIQPDNSVPKYPLPMANAPFNCFFPVPAPYIPPVFFPAPPIPSGTVCAECFPLKRTVDECRNILGHIAAPFFVTTTPMISWTTPTIPGPSLVPPRSAPQHKFKRMCDACRAQHQSLHHCRVVLKHDAPEWKSSHSGRGTKPRSRSKK